MPAPAVRQVLRTGADPNPPHTHPYQLPESSHPTFSRVVQSPPAETPPPVPALYLLPGRDGKGERVDMSAVVQQDSSNPLTLLLEGEGLIPVPSASVRLCSRAILQAEHDGDIHILIPSIFHLPDENSHWQAGVLAETDNTMYRAGAPQLAIRTSLLLLGRPCRMQKQQHCKQLGLQVCCQAGEHQHKQRILGGR